MLESVHKPKPSFHRIAFQLLGFAFFGGLFATVAYLFFAELRIRHGPWYPATCQGTAPVVLVKLVTGSKNGEVVTYRIDLDVDVTPAKGSWLSPSPGEYMPHHVAHRLIHDSGISSYDEQHDFVTRKILGHPDPDTYVVNNRSAGESCAAPKVPRTSTWADSSRTEDYFQCTILHHYHLPEDGLPCWYSSKGWISRLVRVRLDLDGEKDDAAFYFLMPAVMLITVTIAASFARQAASDIMHGTMAAWDSAMGVLNHRPSWDDMNKQQSSGPSKGRVQAAPSRSRVAIAL